MNMAVDRAPEDRALTPIARARDAEANGAGCAGDRRGPAQGCRFCADKALKVDYKDVRTLQSFITEGGKIVPAGLRAIARAISANSRSRSSVRA